MSIKVEPINKIVCDSCGCINEITPEKLKYTIDCESCQSSIHVTPDKCMKTMIKEPDYPKKSQHEYVIDGIDFIKSIIQNKKYQIDYHNENLFVVYKEAAPFRRLTNNFDIEVFQKIQNYVEEKYQLHIVVKPILDIFILKLIPIEKIKEKDEEKNEVNDDTLKRTIKEEK